MGNYIESWASLLCNSMVSFFGIFLSLFSLIYICAKLQINRHVRKIFLCMAVENLLAFGTNALGYFLMILSSEQNLLNCSLLLVPIPLAGSSFIVKNGLISITRFFLVWKISLKQVVNNDKINLLINLAHFIHHVSFALRNIISFFMDQDHPVEICAHQKVYGTPEQVTLPQKVFFVYICTWAIVGMIADVKLALFIIKRNRNVVPAGESQVQIWTSVCKDDPGVPIRATILVTISGIFFLAAIAVVNVAVEESSDEIKALPMLILNSWLAGILPLTLWLAVKHKKKAGQTQPPQELQFHELESSQSENRY